jgi:hypothetical protein
VTKLGIAEITTPTVEAGGKHWVQRENVKTRVAQLRLCKLVVPVLAMFALVPHIVKTTLNWASPLIIRA